ncbi:MAG: HD-GYP domain-containing protein [Candidatus Eremiobacteraeota bacterium]|nr:HD-GYP domain-containing protein [Candidatus Eremiobacteraeota bacterium]
MASAALLSLGTADRTISSEVVLLRFVERFAAAVYACDWTILLGWVDASCRRYAGILPAGRLVCAAVDVVTRAIASAPETPLGSAELDLVRSEVERLAARPRLVRDPAAYEAIDEIDVALDDLITRLGHSDPLTAEHSRAVSAWCGRLARRLALAKEDVIHVTRCGLIHDIGKITTPPAILNAPRALDEEEMAVMRRHAEEGAKIIAATPLAASMTPAVRNHHERFDGGGYPDGLRGGAIPSPARIVAVADAFNAMIGRRPYRPPFAPSVALERLVACRGTQFDPIVVDAMIDVVSNRTLARSAAG